MIHKLSRYLLTLTALFALSTGAWANWTGGTYKTSGTDEEILTKIEVTDDATLTIKRGVTVKVFGGIEIATGATLTVTGGGTLYVDGELTLSVSPLEPGGSIIPGTIIPPVGLVNGTDGAQGNTAIKGNIIVKGATVYAYGEKGKSGGRGYNGGYGGDGGDGGIAILGDVTIYSGKIFAIGGDGGNGGDGGDNDSGDGGDGGDGGYGGNGGFAIDGNLTVKGGNVTLEGGDLGDGGDGGDGSDGNIDGDNGKPGFNAKAFNREKILTIENEDATMYEDAEHTTPVASADIATAIKNLTYFRIVSPNESDIELSTDATEEGDIFTEASFTQPANDATVEYELVRDMGFAVNAVMPVSIRIQQKQQGGGYEPVNPEEITPKVKDEISGTAVPMIEKTQETEETGEYTLQLQKKVDDEWTSVSPDVLGPGTYRYVVTGANLYDGTTTTNEFQLIEGYPVTVPAHGFVTYYSDEKLTINDAAAGIYTVQQVTGNKAVLSSAINVAPANTPLLIYNTSDEPKTFLLIPTDGDADEVSYAAQFKGTLVNREMPGSDDETDYYVCNGFDFAWVKQAGTLAANRCWMEITNQSQGARTINIVFGDGTGLNAIGNGQLTNADGDLYDLNGRKVGSTFNVQRSTLKKGVYIRNGKKVIKK